MRVPLGWAAKKDMCSLANPLEADSHYDTTQKQTVEMRSPDGSADLYQLLAGLAVGFWKDKEEARASHRLAHVYEPQMSAEERAQNYSGWKNAVAHTLTK